MQFGIANDIGIIVQVPGRLEGIGVGAKDQQEQHPESDIWIPFKSAVAIIGHRNCDLKTEGSDGYVYQLSIVNRTPDPQYQQFVASLLFVIWKTKRGSDASPFSIWSNVLFKQHGCYCMDLVYIPPDHSGELDD
jgi:hypothetical protein